MGAEQSELDAGNLLIDPNRNLFNIERRPTRALLRFPPLYPRLGSLIDPHRGRDNGTVPYIPEDIQ